MKEIKSYKVEDIDYGHLCREFSNATKFKDWDSWDGYSSTILICPPGPAILIRFLS